MHFAISGVNSIVHMYHICNFKVQRNEQSKNNVYRCHFRQGGGFIKKICTSTVHLEIKN